MNKNKSKVDPLISALNDRESSRHKVSVLAKAYRDANNMAELSAYGWESVYEKLRHRGVPFLDLAQVVSLTRPNVWMQ